MLKNGFCQRKMLKYKNNKTFYQKSAGLHLLQGWYNLKKFLVFALDQKWQLMSAFIQVREKGAKKAKKMDFAKTKTEI